MNCDVIISTAAPSSYGGGGSFRAYILLAYIPVIDQFVVSLAHRLSAYEELCSRFGFLGKLESLSPVEIESSADNLVIVYKDDI